jgi:hypothetical protein
MLEVPLIVLVGFTLLWVTPKAVWRPYIVPDATEAYYATRSLVEQGSYTITVNGAPHPPRYSYGYSVYFLAPAYRLTGRPEAMFAVPMLCGIANMALMYVITRRLLGPGIAVIAALLVPGLPAYYLTSWDILSHVPSLTLFLLITLLAPGVCDRSWQGVLSAIAVGALSGVAVTMRPTSVLFLLPPMVVLIAGLARLRGDFWLRGSALLAGAVPFVLPLLESNLHTFGKFTRTGYSYWCASIYDLPGKSFRFDFSTIRDGFLYYAIPLELEPDFYRISALPLLVLSAGAVQIVVGLIRGWRGNPAQRQFAIFAFTTLFLTLCLYLPYTFRFYWFAYPAYACMIPFLAGGLGCLWLGIDSGPRADRLRVAGLFLILLLCVVQRWYSPLKLVDPRLRTGQQLRKLTQLLPRDAVFFSNRDPLSVHEDVERGTDRIFVPLNRATEYTWTQITPRPPVARTAEAIAAASKPVFLQVFEDDPVAFLQRYPGRRIFLETVTSGTYSGALPPDFELVQLETGATVVLYEVVPRLAKGG